MTHKGTVTLEAERLILRRFEPDDAEAMFRNWVNDADVTKYLTWKPHGSIDLTRKISLSDISKYDNLSHYQWAIVLKELNEPIGGINVVKVDETCNCLEVAYRIGKAWWNQGFASEALSAVIKFLFEQVGANRIAATHDTRNPNSGRVMLKCGMNYEGTLRQSGCNNQGIYDAACYAILAEDYFMAQHNSKNLTFAPYNLNTDREFLIMAHTETFKLTFKQDIKPEWLDAELAKPRDVRDGAYLDGKLVGVCDLQRRSREGNDDYGKVNFYYIAPEYRNRGFGGQLITHSVDWCRSQGLKMLTLNTGKDNFGAQKCYEHNGFVRFPQIDTDDEWGYVKIIGNPNTKTVQLCTELMFHNLKIAMDTVNWNADICCAPAWRYIYHTLHSADKWFINPGNRFKEPEPPFHTSKLDWPDTPSDTVLSRETLYSYYKTVREKVLDYIDKLDDAMLSNIPDGCKSTRLGLIMSQFRHMYAHIGIFNGITIANTGQYPRVINESTWRSGKLPDGLYDDEVR